MAIIKINMRGPAGSAAGEDITEFVWNEINFAFGTGRDDIINKTGESRRQVIDAGAGNDKVTGGLAADYIDGGDDNDTLSGSKGADTLVGGLGDDVLYADSSVNLRSETSANLLSGGDGADTIYGANGKDTLDGGEDGDLLFGYSGADVIRGDGGDDTIDGGLGRDLIKAGEGNDNIAVDSNDVVYGGADDDTITGSVTNAQIYGEDGIDTITVTVAGAATITGGEGDDKITVSGTGRVYVAGDVGDDVIETGSGADTVNGGGGSNAINLGEGDDTLILVLRDKVIGRDTSGSLIYEAGDTVEAGIGIDTLRIEMSLKDFADPATRADVVKLLWDWKSNGTNTIAGSEYNNFENAIVTVNGFKVLQSEGIGGSGPGAHAVYQSDQQDPAQPGATADADTIIFAQVAEYDADKAKNLGLGTDEQWAGKFVDLGNSGDFVILGDVINGVYQGPAFLEGRKVSGQDGDDTMIGQSASDKIDGGKGSDLIWGGAGDDLITGGVAGDGDTGRDSIDGGSGDDTITFVNGGLVAGGSGHDTITGSGKIADARIDGGTASDEITIIMAGTGVSIDGGSGSDKIKAYGGFGTNATEGVTVDGGDGNDVIDTGLDRADVRANDTVRGGTGDDQVATGDGHDYLDGGTGNDTLNGGDGNDLLVGGDGADVLFGEGGSDTFLFSRDFGYTTETVEFDSNTIDQYQVELGVEGLRGSNDRIRWRRRGRHCPWHWRQRLHPGL